MSSVARSESLLPTKSFETLFVSLITRKANAFVRCFISVSVMVCCVVSLRALDCSLDFATSKQHLFAVTPPSDQSKIEIQKSKIAYADPQASCQRSPSRHYSSGPRYFIFLFLLLYFGSRERRPPCRRAWLVLACRA